jgi:hemoglobin-like flavoprotein
LSKAQSRFVLVGDLRVAILRGLLSSTPEEDHLNQRQKELVKSSFAKVLPISDQAAELFYGRLFEIDPSLRSLFKIDMKEQGRKLMQMIAIAVRGLDDLGTLVPVVLDLGRRHVTYGVKDEHYETVGAALLWTLEKGLGDDFTPETKEAWVTVYGVLSATMKEAGGSKTQSAG